MNVWLPRLFGIFFIISFLSYGFGDALIVQVTSGDILQNVLEQKSSLVIGVVLMALVHSVSNVGLGALMLPILKPYSRFAAYGYFAGVIMATLTIVTGAISLMLLIPLAQDWQLNPQDHHQTIALLLSQAGYYSYQLSMAIWALAGLLFVGLLWRSKLVPGLFPVWGLLGYLIFLSGIIMELFGLPYGVMLSLPGGLFEIGLSGWLIVKGFKKNIEA